MKTDRLLMTEAEAAEALRLCTRTLRKARALGQLRYILVGRAVRYTAEDLQSWIDSLRQASPQCPPAQTRTRTAVSPQDGATIVPFHLRNRKPGSERL